MSNIAPVMTYLPIEILRARVAATQKRQKAHATRMKAKRADQRDRKLAIIEKGEDVIFTLDCRNGSPELRSTNLMVESRPRHPLVERRDAMATGRLVKNHRPDTWDRFGSSIASDHLPTQVSQATAMAHDRGNLPLTLQAEGIDENMETVEWMPFHQGDEPSSVRIIAADRSDFIDPAYIGMEDERARTFAWTM